MMREGRNPCVSRVVGSLARPLPPGLAVGTLIVESTTTP